MTASHPSSGPENTGGAGSSPGDSAWQAFRQALAEARAKLEEEQADWVRRLSQSGVSRSPSPEEPPSGEVAALPPATERTDPSTGPFPEQFSGLIERMFRQYRQTLEALESQLERAVGGTRAGGVNREDADSAEATLQHLRRQLEEKTRELENYANKELQRAETINRLQARMDQAIEEHRANVHRLEEALQQKDRQIQQHLQALRIREDQLRQSVQRAEALNEELARLRQERDALAEAVHRDSPPAGLPFETDTTSLAKALKALPAGNYLITENGILPAGGSDSDELRPAVTTAQLVGLLVLTALILALGVHLTHHPRFEVVGRLLVEPADPQVLALCEKVAWQPGVAPADRTWRTQADAARGVLSLYLETSSADEGVQRLDTIGVSLVEHIHQQVRSPTGTQPALHELERQRIRRRLEELLAESEATTAPATAPAGSPAALALVYQERQAERRQLAARLSQLAQRITAEPPAEAEIDLDPMELRQAEGNLKQLQADMTALNLRKARLIELLIELIADADRKVTAFQSHASQVVEFLEETARGRYEAEVIAAVKAIQAAVAGWYDATKTWQELATTQNGLLTASLTPDEPDVLQAALEQGARQYLERADRSETEIRQRLQSITEGGEEPVKRTVLHRNLSQRLRPMLESGAALSGSVSAFILDSSAQLAAVTHTVSSLKSRVADQRRRLEAELRAQALAEARARNREEVQQAVSERDRLLQRDRDLEAEMNRIAGEALDVLAHWEGLQRAWTQVSARAANLTETLRAYLAIPETPVTVVPAVRVVYTPAFATPITDPLGVRLARTLAIGLGPMLLGGLALIVWSRWLQRPHPPAATVPLPAETGPLRPRRGTEEEPPFRQD